MSQKTSKFKKLKDENNTKRIHCQDTFTKKKNNHNIKNKIPRRNPSRRWAKSLREIQDLTEWRDVLCQ